MKKKKVLFIMNNVKYGGSETVACNIIKNLKDHFEFVYSCPNGIEKRMVDFLRLNNVEYIEFEKMSCSTLRKLVKKTNPDIVHTNGFISSIFASISIFRAKIVAHLHNYYGYMNKFTLKSVIFGLSCFRYDKVICCQKDILERFIFKGVIKNKAVVIENVVDIAEIKKKAIEYTCEKFYDLIFIGNLVDRKDPLKFIEIVGRVKNKKENIKVAILGSGILLQECKNKIKELKLEENIEMYGYCENPFPILKNSRLLVMTSKNEGLPMVALEALALNKKVIANINCGLNSIITEINVCICSDEASYVSNIIDCLQQGNNNNISLTMENKFKEYIENINKVYRDY